MPKIAKEYWYICARTDGVWATRNPFKYHRVLLFGPYVKHKANHILSRITNTWFKQVVHYQHLQLMWEFNPPCFMWRVNEFYKCTCYADKPKTWIACSAYHSNRLGVVE